VAVAAATLSEAPREGGEAMALLARTFGRYARWRVARCREQSPWILAVAALFLGSAGVMLRIGLRGASEESVSIVIGGVLVFAAGWAGLGRVFWEHQVWKLKIEIERLSRQGG
jgi:hypothetical protein